MPRSVVCVSHETGAGGRELAAAVAEQLGFRYVDEEVLVRAAENEGVTVDELADVERRQSFLSRLIHDFGHRGGAPLDPGFGIAGEVLLDVPTPAVLRNAIRTAIDDIAADGDVVIVSHAASHALVGRDVLRVLVVAPESDRLTRITAEEGADVDAATDLLARHDAARRDYLRRFYAIDEESPLHYDLVVNTGGLDAAVAASLVAGAAEL